MKPTITMLNADEMNVFSIRALVVDALKNAGQHEAAETFHRRAKFCVMDELIALCAEYVTMEAK